MIVIKMLRAGLGNQLFIYAFGRFLAQKSSQELYVYFPVKQDHGYTFDSGLGQFELACSPVFNICSITKLCKGRNFIHAFYMLREYLGGEHKRINYSLEKKYGPQLAQKNILINYNPGHWGSYFEKIAENTYAVGYFQNAIVCRSIRDELLETFRLSEDKHKKYCSILKRLKVADSVCIHIRRGDFTKSSQHNVCTMEYYKKAVDLISQKLKSPVFYVFSDDIQYVRNNIDIFGNNRYVFFEELKEYEIPDTDELLLMSSCNHHIISNSSFSWWSQFLCQNVNQIVIAPNKWYSSDDACLLYEDHWTLIEI